MAEQRLISGADAAAYCGVTPATFSKWVAAGVIPPPIPGTRRWDRKAIDQALDRASGIPTTQSPEDESDPATNIGREPWEDAFEADWIAWVAHAEAQTPAEERSAPAKWDEAREVVRKFWRDLDGKTMAAKRRSLKVRKS
ncbi:hypothetical protein CWS35_24695 [Bradyrhizobium sp. SK17]|nr:hypothetical protein CWS35_24695 [Bradyrhizobium sp. SK17]